MEARDQLGCYSSNVMRNDGGLDEGFNSGSGNM